MGQIKQLICKAGFPTDLVGVYMESGKLVVSFPVMGASHGWREMDFDPFAGHANIARRIVDTMEMDFYCATYRDVEDEEV